MISLETMSQALFWADKGLPCFPCLEDKRPACPKGFKAASTEASEVERLWREYPATLIGVPTGIASGIDVLDIDPRNQGDQWLLAHQARLPATRVHMTQSGGLHFLFQHKEGLRNSSGKLAQGVDVRAEGGYIIWWPAAGLNVAQGHVLEQWPYWILDQLMPARDKKTLPTVTYRKISSAYANAALENAVLEVSRAVSGCRNDTLNKQAYALFRFIKTGELSAFIICKALAQAALTAGLSEKEVSATLASALRAQENAA